MFQSNARLPEGGGGGELNLRLSHIDGSNQMFLSFKKCPGGDVCKGQLVSEHSINATQLLYNSVYFSCHWAQLNLSGSSFEPRIRCTRLIPGGCRKWLASEIS